MLQHLAHLAVFAFRQGQADPRIGAAVALQPGAYGAKAHPVNGDAFFQRIQIGLGDAAKGARFIAAAPAGGGQLQMARQIAVGGDQQQALGVVIQPANGNHPGQAVRQGLEHGFAPFRVLVAGDQSARLVIAPQAHRLRHRQGLAVNQDAVFGADIQRRAVDAPAVDADLAVKDQFLGVAARTHARPGDHLGDAHGFAWSRLGGRCF